MSSSNLTSTNVEGVEVLDVSAMDGDEVVTRATITIPENATWSGEAVANILQFILHTARNQARQEARSLGEWMAIMNARTTYKYTAKFTLAAMGQAIQLYNTIPACLAKQLINRRLLALIEGFIDMLDMNEPFVDGCDLWTDLDGRRAIFVMNKCHSGFEALIKLLEMVAETSPKELPYFGKWLEREYRKVYGDDF